MKKVDVKSIDIKPHNIVVAVTSEPDYEMHRQILIEINFDKFIVIDGGHCSCYGFDETEWEAIEYTESELSKLANADYNQDDEFWTQVKRHLG